MGLEILFWIIFKQNNLYGREMMARTDPRVYKTGKEKHVKTKSSMD
jgi:hypothetical protein